MVNVNRGVFTRPQKRFFKLPSDPARVKVRTNEAGRSRLFPGLLLGNGANVLAADGRALSRVAARGGRSVVAPFYLLY